MPHSEAEIPLIGGCVTPGLVRVGDTVRRPHCESSAFVAALLRLLEARGVAWAPRYLGLDEQGRHSLSFVPGTTSLKWRRYENEQLRAAALLLRDLHEATRGSTLAGNRAVVCHHDPGPNNVIFHGDRPVALIDFDFAAPGEPLEDLGYMAWSWCVASKPERQPVSAQADQVRVLADAYGLDAAARAGLIEAMLERQGRNAAFWAKQLESTEVIPSTPEKMRERIAWSRRESAFVVENREYFAAALR